MAEPKAPFLKLLPGLAAAALCWALLSVLHAVGVFDPLDLKILDAKYALRGHQEPQVPLALVEVDDATITEMGEWPFPRKFHALLLQALADAGAQAVGVDLQFVQVDDDDPDGDLLLAAVSASHAFVAHAVNFAGGLPGPLEEEPPPNILADNTWPARPGPWAKVVHALWPFNDLLLSAGACGHVNVGVDADGVIRRLPLILEYQGRLYPALSLRLVSLARHGGTMPKLEADGAGAVLSWPDGSVQRIPMDERGATAVNIPGGPRAWTARYSMAQVLRDYRDGKIEALQEAFRHKLVLIGNTAVGESAADIGPTPFGVVTPLVFMHAAAVDALWTGRFITQPATVTLVVLLALSAFGLGYFSIALRLHWAAAVALGWILVTAVLIQVAFNLWGMDVPGSVLLLLPAVLYASVASYRFMVLERFERWRNKEMALAREIQQTLLPQGPPATEQYDVWGLNIPAQEVGGDYFDWARLRSESVVVALGDVAGKGVSASLLVSHLRASFHAEVHRREGPQKIVEAMHSSLLGATQVTRFATFFLAEADPANNRLVFCSAGHNPALLMHQGESIWLGATGPPMAIMGGITFGQEARSFNPGDVLVVYSDGVSEGPVGKDLYGEERLAPLLEPLRQRGADAEAFGRAILRDVETVCGELGDWDDITILVVRRLQPPS